MENTHLLGKHLKFDVDSLFGTYRTQLWNPLICL